MTLEEFIEKEWDNFDGYDERFEQWKSKQYKAT
jgi:hypothetical protein